jgi:hypothetical protein
MFVAYVAILILAPRLAHSAEASHTIDVLVVYPGAAQGHLQQMIQYAEAGNANDWGETEMGPFLDATLARVSQIYTQSGIDVEFRVAHHQQIDLSYIDADWNNNLISALMNRVHLQYDPATLPYVEAIEAIRDAHVADIVIYWRDFDDGGPIASGAGGIGVGEDEAYTHITYGQFDPYTIAHEIGHLLGGQHSDGVQGEATFSRNGDTANLREYITVMTVANPLPGLDRFFLWRFSSNGASVIGDNDCKGWHVSTLLTCNFSTAASLGDENHNVVPILSAMVPAMAGFRSRTPEAPSTPTITATDYEDGTIRLTVSVADNGGANITNYEATCTDTSHNSFTSTSATTTITVSALTNGTSYTCTVTATNAALILSSASAPTADITPEALPTGLPIWLLYQATQ